MLKAQSHLNEHTFSVDYKLAIKMNITTALFYAVALLMVTADGYESPEDKEQIDRLIGIANEQFKALGKQFKFSERLKSEVGCPKLVSVT